MVSIDGLIGAGKSTFCDVLAGGGIHVAKEPLKEWVLGDFDLLKTFYASPSRYAYMFQTHCLRSRVEQMRLVEEAALAGAAPQRVDGVDGVVFMERGVASDKIFADAQFRLGNIEPVEYEAYKYQYRQALRDTMRASARLYVRTSLDTCAKRVASRARDGEGAIDVSYLRLLEELHEEFMEAERLKGTPVLVIDGEKNFLDSSGKVQQGMIEEVRAWADEVMPPAA